MEQFAVYGNVTRDPRARIITSAYLSVVDEGQVKVQAGDDAADAKWMQLHCQTESDRIACDHAALIVQAWKLVESRLI